MSKILSLMVAVALSTAAGSAMASTVTLGTLSTSNPLNFSSAISSSVLNVLFTAGGSGSLDITATATDVSSPFSSAYLIDTSNGNAIIDSMLSASKFVNFLDTLVTGHVYNFKMFGTSGTNVSGGLTADAPSPVPLPAAGLLFGTALLGAAGLGRKKRVAEQADAVAA